MEKIVLEKLLSQKMTIKKVSCITGMSQSTVRYWMKKYGLKPTANRKTWTDEEMFDAIKDAKTVTDVLRKLGLTIRPGNYNTFNVFVKTHNVDISHMVGSNCGRGGVASKPLDEVLVKNSMYSTSNLKRRLIKDGLLKNKCSICGLCDEWNFKSIVMVLDHINGDHFDNRIDNLRLLCPNCNSQQLTFCRTKKSFEPKRKYYCKCGKEKDRTSKLCIDCHHKKLRKTGWPAKEELIKLIQKKPMTHIGKMFGVSDNAVRKWAKHYGIDVKAVKKKLADRVDNRLVDYK